AGDLLAGLFLNDAQIEGVAGTEGLIVDLQPQAIAPGSLHLGGRDEYRGALVVVELDGGAARAESETNDVAIAATVVIEELDAEREFAAAGGAAECPDEVGVAETAHGPIDR